MLHSYLEKELGGRDFSNGRTSTFGMSALSSAVIGTKTPDLDPTSQLRLHILHLSLLQPVHCHCQSLLLALPSTGKYDVTETSESPILPLNFLHLRKYQFYVLFLRSFPIMTCKYGRTDKDPQRHCRTSSIYCGQSNLRHICFNSFQLILHDEL